MSDLSSIQAVWFSQSSWLQRHSSVQDKPCFLQQHKLHVPWRLYKIWLLTPLWYVHESYICLTSCPAFSLTLAITFKRTKISRVIISRPTMSTSEGKRRMPWREIPWIGKLLDRIPDSKLPTKQVVLQRLSFLLEHSSGPASGESAKTTARNELMSVWEYVGFYEVLKEPCQHHQQCDQASPPEI